MTRLVFGEITLAEAERSIDAPPSRQRGDIYWNGKWYDWRLRNAHPKHNPCIDVFGAGPEDAGCKTCSHLELHGGNAQNYYKCNLRPISGGPGTDHRLNWPACGKYEERT